MREMSEKSIYYIPKERKLELIHFVRQYNQWKKRISQIEGQTRPQIASYQSHGKTFRGSSVEKLVLEKERYQKKIDMVEKCAKEAVGSFKYDWYHVIEAVIHNLSYEQVQARGLAASCSRAFWYETMKKFFYLLDIVVDEPYKVTDTTKWYPLN